MDIQERNKAIAADYVEGCTLRQLAEKYGVSSTRCHQIVHEHGVKVRPVGNPNFKVKE